MIIKKTRFVQISPYDAQNTKSLFFRGTKILRYWSKIANLVQKIAKPYTTEPASTNCGMQYQFTAFLVQEELVLVRRYAYLSTAYPTDGCQVHGPLASVWARKSLRKTATFDQRGITQDLRSR